MWLQRSSSRTSRCWRSNGHQHSIARSFEKGPYCQWFGTWHSSSMQSTRHVSNNTIEFESGRVSSQLINNILPNSRQAVLAILAESCEEPQYKKLITALCNEHQIPLIRVDSNKKLGEWSGLCKIDKEGKPRKVCGCSVVVIKVSIQIHINCSHLFIRNIQFIHEIQFFI